MADYIGRFAPSPTGPLHLGSLYAALASYLDARSNSGQWLLRMEDIDPPREVPGAADTILRQLELHGLYWDGPVLYQSRRLAAYQQALLTLSEMDLLYPCQCNRARLRSLNHVYDGHCRPGNPTPNALNKHGGSAIRIQVPADCEIYWHDIVQGQCRSDLSRSTGDFIIVRRDGLFAYQLAVSIDDAYQCISHVIRGDDLLDSTPRQLYLLQKLGLQIPSYGHVPVIKNNQGTKLSKQTFAPALPSSAPGTSIEHCLALLGMSLPNDAAGAPVEQLLQWASQHWMRTQIPLSSVQVIDPS